MLGELILVRGIPGSGKSTFASEHYPDFHQMKTDLFFIVDGEYKFDRDKLVEYHKKCQHMTQTLLDKGENVIVTNTFIRLWELQKYTSMNFSELTVIRLNNTPSEIHNVPDKVVKRMDQMFEDYEGEIIVEN